MSQHEIFSDLYQSMFQAKQAGDALVAEALMIKIEQLRSQMQPTVDPRSLENEFQLLPAFAQSVLGKSNAEMQRRERSNCINASFNYHDDVARWETYSTMDFLERVQRDFIQLVPDAEPQRGDLIVLWSRVGGSWDHRKINVLEMNLTAPDFPYGLVFDHVAVRLNGDLVFHKPDPTPESRYLIESVSAIMAVTSANRGFETTYHRKRESLANSLTNGVA